MSKQQVDNGAVFFVLDTSKQPAIVVLETKSLDEAIKMRDEYQRVHGGRIVLSSLAVEK